MKLAGEAPALPALPALQRHRFYFIAKIQNEFHIAEPVQQTGMNNVHDVRKIQGAISAFGPAAVAAEEFSGARVSQQSFHRLFQIHVHKIAYNSLIPNRV